MKFRTLTTQEEINLLTFIRGEYAITCLEEYQCVENYREPNPDPIKFYLSCLLGFNYGEEVYNNEKITKICKTIDIEKSLDVDQWFIGDAFSDIFYEVLVKDYGDVAVDAEVVEELNERVVYLWDRFKGLKYEHFSLKHEYVETDIELDGEKLYRRIKHDS